MSDREKKIESIARRLMKIGLESEELGIFFYGDGSLTIFDNEKRDNFCDSLKDSIKFINKGSWYGGMGRF